MADADVAVRVHAKVAEMHRDFDGCTAETLFQLIDKHRLAREWLKKARPGEAELLTEKVRVLFHRFQAERARNA